MSDQTTLRKRRRIGADVDVPAAHPGATGHQEWLIDVAIEESFPASDSSTAVQPGSLAGRGRGKEASRRDRSKAPSRRGRGKTASR
ncbi:MAG: hypothetical protein GEV05_09595 [Betaproteobacteria bacterium]|nr:hypothetical protein [Betaproteobacteria bacterium]